MRVVLLNYAYAPDIGTPEALLERYETLTGWAEGLRLAGLEPLVVQRFPRDARLERSGVSYHFTADRFGPRLRPWQLPWRTHRTVAHLRPDLVHINGLLFALQIKALRHALPPSTAIVAQHHAERPKSGWRGTLQRWGLTSADGFLFAASELAQPWLSPALRRERVFEVMEGSSWFVPEDKKSARARMGLVGEPIFLWVGRLDANKDPLTVLEGFAKLAQEAPRARLYMVYSEGDLLDKVQARLADSPRLAGSVTLLGRLPHPAMAWFYSSADYFVLGSHYEGSGYALVEALACGLVPIVTDIPSFRRMTNEGRIGGLWKVGESEAFFRTASRVLQAPYNRQAEAARAFFEEHLSFPAIGRQATSIYQTLVTHRRAS